MPLLPDQRIYGSVIADAVRIERIGNLPAGLVDAAFFNPGDLLD